MKKVIRKNIFETNSSSVHAICIGIENYQTTLPKHLKFTLGEFGWESDKLDCDYERASYLWTAICYLDPSEIPVKDPKEHISNVLGTIGVACDFEDPSVDTSFYIDHGSELVDWVEVIMSDDEKLKRYLFSADSVVVTGNDNCDSDNNNYNFSDDCEVFYKYN